MFFWLDDLSVRGLSAGISPLKGRLYQCSAFYPWLPVFFLTAGVDRVIKRIKIDELTTVVLELVYPVELKAKTQHYREAFIFNFICS
ncbi:MAG: hypothetical protein C0168_06945 [Candidatus Aminicenantes bacterium]|nr:MAG: hypothetical protein C0168_06945 [Candidatus Aminicenantes bacterium]